MAEWGWDGLKLDFIDMFTSDDTTVFTAADARDYASVYDAVDRLMTDIVVDANDAFCAGPHMLEIRLGAGFIPSRTNRNEISAIV